MFLHHLLSYPSFFFLCVWLVSLNPQSTSLSNDCINTSKCTFCFTTLAAMVCHLRHIAHYGTQCIQQFSLHACLQYHKVHMYLEMQNKLWKIKSVDVSCNCEHHRTALRHMEVIDKFFCSSSGHSSGYLVYCTLLSL